MTDAPRHQIAAILPCRDLDASTAFYQKLGLSVVDGDDSYRLLEDGKGWQLHLSTESTEGWLVPGRNPLGLYLYTEHVAELAVVVRDAIIEKEKAPTHKPGGMYEFALSDPDQTLVRVGWPSEPSAEPASLPYEGGDAID